MIQHSIKELFFRQLNIQRFHRQPNKHVRVSDNLHVYKKIEREIGETGEREREGDRKR